MADEPFRGLTLDLDDTLWPVQAIIVRAERILQDWLRQHAPRCAQQFDVDALRALRNQLLRQRPEWRHDLSRLRLESLREVLSLAGEDPGLAEPAFDVFLAERQNVEFFADVLPALARLSARYPIWALTNGNADIGRVGLSRYFAGAVSARDAGVMKPEPRIFQVACEAMGLATGEVLHIGDDWAMDVAGARGAGLHAAWVDRLGPGQSQAQDLPDAAVMRVSDLLALCDRLGC